MYYTCRCIFIYITLLWSIFVSVFFKCWIITWRKDHEEFRLREKCLYSEFFWFVFSRIRAEDGEILSSPRIQSECGKIWIRKTPNTDTFHAVSQWRKCFQKFSKISKGFQKVLMRKSCETGLTLEINERLMIKVTLLNKFSLKFTLLNGNNSTF